MSRRKQRQLGPGIDEILGPGVYAVELDIDHGLKGCQAAANRLFLKIVARHGIDKARLIFKKIGTKPPPRELARTRSLILLGQYDIMQEPNVEEFARTVAEENKELPRKEQRGAGSTNATALIHHIRDLLRKRERDFAAGKISKWMHEAHADFLRQIGKKPYLK